MVHDAHNVSNIQLVLMFITNKRDLVVTPSDTGCFLKDSFKNTFLHETLLKEAERAVVMKYKHDIVRECIFIS